MASNAAYSVTLAAAFLLLNGCGANASGEGKAAAPNAGCTAGKEAGKSEAGLDQRQLCIISANRTHGFTVEMARSHEEQARGLMFRENLPDDRGMLFPYDKPQMLSFWMKNTVIPLDIIFIGADGRVESIAANTTPYSLESISSRRPAIAVLEIRGGLAADLGIAPGDQVNWQ